MKMTPITPGQCFAEYQDTETGMGDAEFPQRDEIHDIASQDIAQGLHLSTSTCPLLSATGGQQDIFICDSVVNVNSFVMASRIFKSSTLFLVFQFQRNVGDPVETPHVDTD